jgi:hypothetical protein
MDLVICINADKCTLEDCYHRTPHKPFFENDILCINTEKCNYIGKEVRCVKFFKKETLNFGIEEYFEI